MLTLEALGVRDSIATFPPDLDLDAVAAIEISRLLLILLWEDILDTVRAAGRADLEPAVERVVVEAREQFGLPQSYRRRARPGPLPLDPGRAGAAREAREREAALGTPGTRRLAAAVLNSSSWKLTAPIRRFRALLR
jgi:hypothetical protein